MSPEPINRRLREVSTLALLAQYLIPVEMEAEQRRSEMRQPHSTPRRPALGHNGEPRKSWTYRANTRSRHCDRGFRRRAAIAAMKSGEPARQEKMLRKVRR